MAGTVKVEVARTGEHVLGTVRGQEETIARKREVGGLVGGLEGTLRPVLVDSPDVDAATYKGRVDAATAGNTPPPELELRQYLVKSRTRAFEAGCVDVGNVITDDVHPDLMRSDSGDAGTKRVNHGCFRVRSAASVGRLRVGIPYPMVVGRGSCRWG